MLELKKIVAALIDRYDVSIVELKRNSELN